MQHIKSRVAEIHRPSNYVDTAHTVQSGSNRKGGDNKLNSKTKPTFLDVFYNKIGIGASDKGPYYSENTANSLKGGQTYLRRFWLNNRTHIEKERTSK